MKNTIYLFILFLMLPSTIFGAEVQHHLNVEIGPFNAAKLEMSYALEKQNYSFVSKVSTAGMFNKLYQFSARYTTHGAITHRKTITKQYKYESVTSAHNRTKELIFNQKGIPQYRLSSKNNKPKKVNIQLPTTPFDASDLQTIFAQLALQFKQNHFCAMEKTVFDGKDLSRIVITDSGKTLLSDPQLLYSGQAWKCSFFIEQLNAEDTDMLTNTTANRSVNFWLMEDKKTKLPYLAKIEIDSTPLGKLKAYTTSVTFKE